MTTHVKLNSHSDIRENSGVTVRTGPFKGRTGYVLCVTRGHRGDMSKDALDVVFTDTCIAQGGSFSRDELKIAPRHDKPASQKLKAKPTYRTASAVLN